MKSRLLVVFTLVASLIVCVLAWMIALQQSVLAHSPSQLAVTTPRSPLASTAVFTVAIGSDVSGLDPALTTDGVSFQVATQLYDTLVAYQPGTSVPIPGLADSWTASADGKTWTFNLRPGLKFHDNTSLDANAVAFNFNRWWDPANPAHIGSFDYFRGLFGGFKGDTGCLLAGIGALNATQFQMTLTQALSPLPSMLAVPAFAIASPTAIQAGTLVTTPVGSGPFVFVEWIPGDHVQLQANANYWSSPPHVSTLTFQ
jgi:peptide/nickel transport system substrate-binding protein